MPDLIVLTPENVERELSDLPRIVRMAFTFGSRLRRGTLDVTLPDGRSFRLGGQEPGPAAQMTLYGYGFASRLVQRRRHRHRRGLSAAATGTRPI